MLTLVPHILQDLNMTTQNIKELNQHAKQHHSTTKTTSENNNITHHNKNTHHHKNKIYLKHALFWGKKSKMIFCKQFFNNYNLKNGNNRKLHNC